MVSLRKILTLFFITVLAVTTILGPRVWAANNTLIDVAYRDGRFMRWLNGISQTELKKKLTEHGSYTVFAPTDAAFNTLSADAQNALKNDTTMRQLVLHHMTQGKYSRAQLLQAGTITTALGNKVYITQTEGNLYINGAKVILTALPASNGLFYGIDLVLPLPTPPVASATKPPYVAPNSVLEALTKDSRYTQFVGHVVNVGISHLLNEKNFYTVLAPTNEALATIANDLNKIKSNHDMYRRWVLNHFVIGEHSAEQLATRASWVTASGQYVQASAANGTTRINGTANIISSRDGAFNGIVHGLDKALFPVGTPQQPADLSPKPAADGTIAGFLAHDPRVKRFGELINSAGLSNLLSKKQQFTVFAPTQEAFDQLSENEWSRYLSNHTLLKQWMLQHIGMERATAQQLQTLPSMKTALGNSLYFRYEGQPKLVVINGRAHVVVADIVLENGVIHLIDAVIPR